MRRTLLLTVALVAATAGFTGMAAAQDRGDRGPDRDQMDHGRMMDRMRGDVDYRGGGGRDDRYADWRDRDRGMRGGRDRQDDEDDNDDDGHDHDRHERMMRMHGMMMERMGGMGGMGAMGRGASFVYRSGDTRLAVRCSPSETMKACVDAATALMSGARGAAAAGPGMTAPVPGATNP